jgi:hypothetical protein
MKIEMRRLSEIKPYETNPRINDAAVDAVAKSLKEFGFRQPIVVDAEGVIVVGHTRWKGMAVAASDDDDPQTLLQRSRRIVFLGDSITAAGQYVAYFDAWLISRREAQAPTVIDAGLPSETVSGLSEEGHAGGQFPRPDLAERLKWVLAITKPDLVIACYGINCAIYEPFDEERFQKYQEGIQRLKSQVESAGPSSC